MFISKKQCPILCASEPGIPRQLSGGKAVGV
jgi:hypothetical protein